MYVLFSMTTEGAVSLLQCGCETGSCFACCCCLSRVASDEERCRQGPSLITCMSTPEILRTTPCAVHTSKAEVICVYFGLVRSEAFLVFFRYLQ